ncbi:SOS response-associated peptidase [Arthrobacter sp. 92]|uniref:SOS response-associated peptidase n=1 Tax=Arthrobacter sp. 92 TaxID=3418175 RepID=UPI003D067C9A
MCGRYVMSRATGDLLSYFHADEAEGTAPPPSWNVAPTDDMPIIAERESDDGPERRLLIARWGLVPSWANDTKIGSRLINARSETILDKPAFRKAAVKRRALVPAEGYYEWEKTPDGKKIPYFLHSDKDDLLAFAGLYEFWPDPSLPPDDPHRWLLSFTVLTTTARDSMGHVHDRAPVIVPSDLFDAWLDPRTTSKDDVKDMLEAIPEAVLTPRVVTEKVNSVRNNGPDLIEPA